MYSSRMNPRCWCLMGSVTITKEWREEVRLLEALQSAILLQSALYIIAFHAHTDVRMALLL